MKRERIEGARLYLRPLLESDAEGEYPGWLNDPLVCAGNSHGAHLYTRDAAREFIRQTSACQDTLTLAIVMRGGDRHIGNIALQHIHAIYRSAELSILLGAREVWGQGYGLEAARLICNHGFNHLNLHRIGCGTFSGNLAMQGLARALGMRKEGLRRSAAFKNQQFVDVIEFGMLYEEFISGKERGK